MSSSDLPLLEQRAQFCRRLRDHRLDALPLEVHGQRARIELREVEDVADQREQALGVGVGDGQQLGLLIVLRK
jgi:hypothetical protein